MWLEGAPDIAKLNTANEQEKQTIIDFYDKLISTENPNMYEPPATEHPCKKKFSDVEDVNLDLAKLLNCVQRHTKCSAGYCLRKDKNNQLKCRFGFPETLRETSSLDCSEKDNYQLFTKRNDPLLNNHTPYLIQT